MKRFLLLSLTIFLSVSLFAQCDELFISEYIEGSNFNKALEIYNPTDNAIDLSFYRVVRWRNGSNVFNSAYSVSLTGMIQPKDVYVAVKEAGTQQDGTPETVFPDLQAAADGFYCMSYNVSSAFYFNGDDALTLEKFDGGQWVVVDLFATTANGDPGDGWYDQPPYTTNFSNESWTTDQTLVRKSTVESGVIATHDNANGILIGVPMEFNPSIEWDSLAENTFANLGMHDCTCDAAANTHPTAVNDAIMTNINTVVTFLVTGNDTDSEDASLDPCDVTIVNGPTNGTLTVGGAPACNLIYTPNAGFVGDDTFDYEVCDSGGLCATAEVTISVLAVNTAPNLIDDAVATPTNMAIVIDVIANDNDNEDGAIDPCDVTIVEQPLNGTITIGAVPNCELTYTPNSGFIGQDDFEYEVCDSEGLCSQATVLINVGGTNVPPIAVNDNATTPMDTPVVVDVVTNDSDDALLDACDITIVTAPLNGVATVGASPDCEVTYTPNSGFIGNDVFYYEICDAGGLCATGAVAVEVTQSSSSNQNINKVALDVYPNPISIDNRSIQIEAGAAIHKISLVSVLGQLIEEEIMDGFSKEITYSLQRKLQAGLYLLKVDFADNQHSIRKVILK